ncbi:hypothetical protein EOB36_11010 [Mesorhizobium sp. M6A.T.Cr.TU.017.01.1.1]|uniref:hypothetical protein n=1 Tax=Mesorhizobium sp. M6A.T.Cr.TU.017.01.1.1 TaxID=2496774 RepID=UPI000FD5C7E9|nr:hypothetical protein [Mesorhizobium sp. M6A.T.Cr.TU.017.01.1.1]RUV02156.1 hypothetical protein EOB36_11010 [Mesorhizobium sp. M6A.T.Cr.TU.017.01.1.1]
MTLNADAVLSDHSKDQVALSRDVYDVARNQSIVTYPLKNFTESLRMQIADDGTFTAGLAQGSKS